MFFLALLNLLSQPLKIICSGNSVASEDEGSNASSQRQKKEKDGFAFLCWVGGRHAFEVEGGRGGGQTSVVV